jgi:hypothetical protein
MALIAPVFLTLILGMAETSRLYEVQNMLSIAAREGARVAGMEREGLVEDGNGINQKIISDVKKFLTANGLPGDEASVYITQPGDDVTAFDLDNPDHELELFRVRVDIPYSEVNPFCVPYNDDWMMSANIVFRNGRSTLVN